eukprot:scaffold227749_cov14-Prasinocladus_malaysianus.AAC.1
MCLGIASGPSLAASQARALRALSIVSVKPRKVERNSNGEITWFILDHAGENSAGHWRIDR